MRGFGMVLMSLGVLISVGGFLGLVIGEGAGQAVVAAALFVGGAVFVGSGEIVEGLRLAREAFARRAPGIAPPDEPDEEVLAEREPEMAHPLRRPGYHRSRAA